MQSLAPNDTQNLLCCTFITANFKRLLVRFDNSGSSLVVAAFATYPERLLGDAQRGKFVFTTDKKVAPTRKVFSCQVLQPGRPVRLGVTQTRVTGTGN